MQEHDYKIPTISQFAQKRVKRLTRKVTFWGILCFIVVSLAGAGFYHYTEIKQGMKVINKGLSQTLGLGGDFIPKHIMKGAISTGNFRGFWVYNTEGHLIVKMVSSKTLQPSAIKSMRIGFQDSQLMIFYRYPLLLNNKKIGSTIAAYYVPFYPILLLIFMVSMTIVLITYFLNNSIHGITSDMAKPIIEMTREINTNDKEFIKRDKNWNLLEVDQLYQTFKEYLRHSKEAEEVMRSAIVSERVASIAYKVKHDIKASLYIAENKLNQIPSELSHLSSAFKSIFDRIYNIADDIPEFEESDLFQVGQEESRKYDLISSHIASIVAEITNEFSTSNLKGKEIKFKAKCQGDSFHSFCEVDISKFKRVLVNLIKNSIEAIPEKGMVNIFLSNDEDFLYLSIEDDGIGMTEEQLNKIGRPGISFKKENGTGLGISSAIENIKNWGGEVNVESKFKQGTKVKVSLPLAEENLLLPTQILIEPNTEVIVADDDPLYLDLYREKFLNKDLDHKGIHFTFVGSTKEMENRLAILEKKGQSYFLLSDQNFGEKEKCGLEIIEELNIEEKSILITSDATNPSFLKKSESCGIPVISKSIIKQLDIAVSV